MTNDVPDILIGDPTRLSQILMNLAGNSLKFTESGSVRIICEQVAYQEDKVKIAFKIRDTGIGISEEYVNKIFESFTQAGTDVARKYGGTGLGLTISKQLVELMEGTISVESKIGEGTTFTFTIPFQIGSEKELMHKEEFVFSDWDVDILNKTNLLLVDDNEFNVILAVDTLKSIAPQIQISEAGNGAEAIEQLKKHGADIILMDIQMPKMSGTKATGIIRTQLEAPLNKTKIIAMTANVMKDDIQRYLDAGMNDHIPKPFLKEELIRKLLKHLDKNSIASRELSVNPESAETGGVENEKPEVAEKTYTEQLTDLRFLVSFAGNDQAKQKKYVGIFLQNAPLLLRQLVQGVENKQYEQIKISAHSLKTQLNYMGVKEEMSHVHELEQISIYAYRHDEMAALVKNLEKVCAKAFSELEEFLK
jgi:hypothetical protein